MTRVVSSYSLARLIQVCSPNSSVSDESGSAPLAYEATGNRSDALELLRKALSGISPTSVEAEVGFNNPSNLVWKLL